MPSLLQGLAACQACGYAYYRTSTRTATRRLYYYRCLGSDDYRYPSGRRCANLPVRADYLDQVIWDHVTALLADPALIRAELDRRLGELQAANPTTATKARLQREQTRTATAISRLVEAYQEQLLSLAELRERMPALRVKQQTLRAQLDALEAELVDQAAYLKLAETLEGFLARLRGKTDTASVPERQRVLRLLVKEVLIGPKRVLIRHRIPVTNPEPTPGYLLRGRSHDPACGVPAMLRRSEPSCITPARSITRKSSRIARSQPRSSTACSNPACGIAANEAATHYPPRRPPGDGHDHPQPSSTRAPSAGGAGLAAPPGQAAADAGPARRLQVADPCRVDRPGAACRGQAAAGAGLGR